MSMNVDQPEGLKFAFASNRIQCVGLYRPNYCLLGLSCDSYW